MKSCSTRNPQQSSAFTLTSVNMISLCITLLLSVTQVLSGQKMDKGHIRAFPGANQSIAGVFQATSLNHLNQPQYAFNASEARQLCLSLGVIIASQAEVQTALSRGLETCRFGWVDEHFAVIPRRRAQSNCGRNQTGLVKWRAPVKQKFDVYCFNESDASIQLKDIHDNPQSTTEATTSTQAPQSTSTFSSLAPEILESEREPVRFVGKAQGSSGGKSILIITTCALLLLAVILFGYFTMQRNPSDLKQHQEEYIETEEWTCVKVIKEPETTSQKEESEEEDDSLSKNRNSINSY